MDLRVLCVVGGDSAQEDDVAGECVESQCEIDYEEQMRFDRLEASEAMLERALGVVLNALLFPFRSRCLTGHRLDPDWSGGRALERY